MYDKAKAEAELIIKRNATILASVLLLRSFSCFSPLLNTRTWRRKKVCNSSLSTGTLVVLSRYSVGPLVQKNTNKQTNKIFEEFANIICARERWSLDYARYTPTKTEFACAALLAMLEYECFSWSCSCANQTHYSYMKDCAPDLVLKIGRGPSSLFNWVLVSGFCC